ncbi:MAG TPA: DUF2804 domain-containing protein [Candidatus Limnocylindrales bacterium]|nr:DUF2804 domain-containing protein [Candidatus Limnocylindrales bacterium]
MNGEISAPVDLCTGSGSLNPDAVGWSRRPLHRCNLSGNRFRKKRWNYWAIQTERFFFAAGIADLDYAANAFVYLVDLRRKAVIEQNVVAPFGRGATFGETVDSPALFRSRRLTFSQAREQDEDAFSILITCDRFDGGDRLSAAVRVIYPEDFETLGVAVPIDHQHFQYTSKHVAVPMAGRVRIGRNEIPFEGIDAFATFDFGRGVWPRRTSWNWGAASGYVDEANIGINLGGKWTDGTGTTENAVFVNGRLIKIHEDLEWSYNELNFLEQWRVRAPLSGDVDLLFEPIVERQKLTDAVLVRSRVHQVFGIWSGTVRGETGETIEIPYLFGWAEEHHALW